MNTWANTSPSTRVNTVAYMQNVQYSQQSQKPSYTAPASNGTNPGYANQTYVLPNGAISDWGGTIIKPAPAQPSVSKSK
jgi:hypothetical protein